MKIDVLKGPADKKDQVALVPQVVKPDVPSTSASPCSAEAVNVSLLSRPACHPLSVAEERALKPKVNFKECDNCPEMVVVPSGSFTMGSPAGETARSSDEGPLHLVKFGQQFAVGRFAVTFDEWDACVADGGCNGYRPADHGWGRGQQPLINVSWDDAKTYLTWLSQKTGKTYRLLSEAEREYVTRAGTSGPFWWGSAISTDQANYFGGFGNRPTSFREKPIPGNSFTPNPWGLYQLHGNVWDWVEDCYHDGYMGAPSDGSAWLTDGNCVSRVLRGGSWAENPEVLRAAVRKRLLANFRHYDGGFRVARTLLAP